jgi:hypothetical protein
MTASFNAQLPSGCHAIVAGRFAPARNLCAFSTARRAPAKALRLQRSPLGRNQEARMSSGDPRTLDDLTASIALLTHRVERLEEALSRNGITLPAERAAPRAEAPASSAIDLALIGRSVVVIGGAWLLRAATELDAVPDALGAAFGIVYALVLLALADRAAGRRRSLDAALHGATALIVAYPLIAELVQRFHLLEPWSAALAIALFAGAGVAVAARRGDAALAWVVVGGTCAATVGTAFATRALVPYIGTLAALAGAAEWLSHRLGRPFFGWPPAAAADFLLGVVVFAVLVGRSTPGDAALPLLAPASFLIFAGGAMGRAAADRADTTLTEMLQVGIALVVGFAGGAAAAVAAGAGTIYGVAGLLLAATGSLLALRLQSVPFWTSLWLAVGLISLTLLAGGAALALVLVALGVALVVAGPRAHAAAELQGLVTLGAAAIASGLLASAWRGMVGAPVAAAPPLAAFAVLAALAGALFAVRADGSRRAWATQLVALVLALVHAAGIAAWAATAATAAGRPMASALRTVVLAVAAVAAAALARSPRARPAAVLVYPLLGLAVLKVFLEDLAVGTAATQTIGIVVTGAAIIVAARLKTRR